MSVIRFNKIFLLSFLLVFVLLFPSTALAMVATPSDAVEVPVASSNDAEIIQSDNVYIATSSNAFPSQEYMDTDGFDTLDAPALFSSGDASFSNTVNLSSMTVGVYYRDSGNQLRYETFPVDASGHFSTTSFPDFSSVANVRFIFNRGSLPPSGNYNLQFYFGSVTGGFSYSKCNIAITKTYPNTATDSSAVQGVSFTQSSGDISLSTTVNLSSASTLELIFYVSGLQPPYGGDIIAAFTPSNSSPVLNSPSTGNVSDSTNYDVTDAVQQQVEQGETIIELIKNTIQTISSQLTSFWNQLAGEFTNLYNKMNQQHQESIDKVDEQIDNDNSNTDKVTTAIESHGNFIIEGLKKLFIPSDEYFKAYFDDLYSWFSERFGFLSFPIDLLLEVIDIFVNSSQTDCVLVLPSFTIMENLLWPEMSFNLTEFLNTNFSFVVVAIKTVTSIYLVMAFVQLCEEKWNEVMMN